MEILVACAQIAYNIPRHGGNMGMDIKTMTETSKQMIQKQERELKSAMTDLWILTRSSIDLLAAAKL